MPYVTTWERRARKEGAQDRNIEIARNLLKKGLPLDIISETTGLSRSEVESLQAEEPVH